MTLLHAVGHALAVARSMTWEVLWALILGFFLSGVVQAVVRKDEITRLLPDDRPRTLGIATGLGAASSSCSYAAVALARSLFRKGADFTSAMAFEIASTNLVVELGIILALLMGWQFTLAEFAGGPLMILLMALAFRLWVRGRIVDAAREQADKGLAGSMEGHAAMDMSVHAEGSIWQRLRSPPGFTSTASTSSWTGRPSTATSSAACCWPGRRLPGCPTPSGRGCSWRATTCWPPCERQCRRPAAAVSLGSVGLASACPFLNISRERSFELCDGL